MSTPIQASLSPQPAPRRSSNQEPAIHSEDVNALAEQMDSLVNVSEPLLRALSTHQSDNPGDLNFERGQILHLLRKENDSWWVAKHERGGKEGRVPAKLVEVVPEEDRETPLRGFGPCSLAIERRQKWFHGPISRETAEFLLHKFGCQDGSFLIRESTNFPGDFTMSLVDKQVFKHYRIRRVQPTQAGNGPQGISKLTIGDEHEFDNVNDLVKYYHENETRLPTKLIKYCPKMTEKMRFDKRIFLDWEIDFGELELGKELGSGQFGDVLAGTYKGKTVAIKMLKHSDDTQIAEEFLSEAFVMTELHHPNLLSLHGVVTTTQPICIITELSLRGSLLEVLSSRGKGMADELPGIAKQISSGMAYMESKGFVHRDLAARNILVFDPHTVKVADFGLTRRLAPEMAGTNAPVGTIVPIKWTAPEVVRQNFFVAKSDVWSFGVTLWEIFSYGRVPYARMGPKELMVFLEKGERLQIPKGCPLAFFKLMQKCWEWKPHYRPSFAEIESQIDEIMANPALLAAESENDDASPVPVASAPATAVRRPPPPVPPTN